MKIILSLLLIGLVFLSSGLHIYHVWKKNDRKTLTVQIAIISLAIIAGILYIYDFQDTSIASVLNHLSPLEK
jgi:hypothetical protein